MAKKKVTRVAVKAKATPKVEQPSTKTEKVEKKPMVKANTEELPSWLKSSPTEYAAGTEDYRSLIEKGNELLNMTYNTWRVKPPVLYGIFEAVTKHYKGEK